MPAVPHLEPKDIGLAYQCVKALIDGDHADENEFHTIFGKSKNEARKRLLADTTKIDVKDRKALLSISNIVGYVAGQMEFGYPALKKWVQADIDELLALENKLDFIYHELHEN